MLKFLLHTSLTLLLLIVFSCQPAEDFIHLSDNSISISDTLIISTYSKNLLYAGFDASQQKMVFVDNTLDSLSVLEIDPVSHYSEQLLFHREGEDGIGKRLSCAGLKADGGVLFATERGLFITQNGITLERSAYKDQLFNELDRRLHYVDRPGELEDYVLAPHTAEPGHPNSLLDPEHYHDYHHFTRFVPGKDEVTFTGDVNHNEQLYNNPGYRSFSVHHEQYQGHLYFAITPIQEIFVYDLIDEMVYSHSIAIKTPEFLVENPKDDIYVGLLSSSDFTGMAINDQGILVLTYRSGVPRGEINLKTFDPNRDARGLAAKFNRNHAIVVDLSTDVAEQYPLGKSLGPVLGAVGSDFLFQPHYTYEESPKGETFFLMGF